MKKAVIILFLVIVGAAAYQFHLIDKLSDTEQVRATIESFGLLAPVVFVLLITFLNPFFIPILTFVIPAALIWDFPTLLFLTWLGVMGSCIVGFFFARSLARDYVSDHLPESLKAYDGRIKENGFRTTVVIRFVVGLVPPSHWLLGLSQVKFVPYMLGSVIGFAPLVLIVTYVVSVVGTSVGEWLSSQPSSTWWIMGGAIASLVVVRLILRRRRGDQHASNAESAR